MALPTPPVDTSGGYLSLRARDSDTGRRHSIRLHVVDFDETFNYVADGGLMQPTPTEGSIADTVAAFGAEWAKHYSTNWKLSLRSVYKVIHADATVNGVPRFAGVPFRTARPPGIAAIPGVGLDNTVGVEHAIAHMYNFTSLSGGRARITLIGLGGEAIDVGSDVVANAGGTDEEKLVAYLSGNDTAICAHDGGRLDSVANLTVDALDVLRRKYEFD